MLAFLPAKPYRIFLDFIKFRDVAQPGSAFAWGARGRWFKSSHPDQPHSGSGQFIPVSQTQKVLQKKLFIKNSFFIG